MLFMICDLSTICGDFSQTSAPFVLAQLKLPWLSGMHNRLLPQNVI